MNICKRFCFVLVISLVIYIGYYVDYGKTGQSKYIVQVAGEHIFLVNYFGVIEHFNNHKYNGSECFCQLIEPIIAHTLSTC